MRGAIRIYFYISVFTLLTQFFSLSQVSAQAQTTSELEWEKEIRGNFDENLKVLPLVNDQYLVYGQNEYGDSIMFRKIDNQGNEVWKKEYGSNAKIEAQLVTQTDDGGYLFCGSLKDNTENVPYVIKTDESGAVQWEKKYPLQSSGFNLATVKETKANYTLVYTETNKGNVHFITLDKEGSEISRKTYENSKTNGINWAQATKDDGFLLVGGNYAVKVDSNLKTIWQKKLESYLESDDELLFTDDSGFIIGTKKDSPFDDNMYVRKIAIQKYDSSGKKKWQNTIMATSIDLQQMKDGGFAILAPSQTFHLYGLGVNGKRIWEWERKKENNYTSFKTISVFQTEDKGYQIFALKNGNLYMAKLAPFSPKEASKLIVDNENIQIRDREKEFPIKATIVYKDGTKEDVTTIAFWGSNKSATAYVNNGYVYSRKLGVARITVNYLDYWKTFNVQVVPFPEVEYVHTFGETDSEKGNAVVQVNEDEFVIAGVKGDREQKGYLAKVNNNGKTLWEKTFCWKNKKKCAENNSFHHILQTSDKGYLLLGTTSDLNEKDDIYLVKTDSNGKMVWQKTYGENNRNDYGASVIEVDKGYIIVGWNTIRMIDKTGQILWEKEVSPGSYGSYSSAIEIEDGYLFGGSGVITRADQDGNEVWTKNYSTEGNFTPLHDGSFVAAEVTTDSLLRMIKVGPDGKKIWEKEYNRDSRYDINKIIPTNDNGFVFSEVSQWGEVRITAYDGSGIEKGKIAFQSDTSPSPTLFWSPIQTKDGGFLFTGYDDADTVNHMVTSDAVALKLFPLNDE